MIILLILLCASGPLWSQGVKLHLATWPSSAELSLHHPHHPQRPSSLRSPAIVEVPTDSLLPVYVYKAGYVPLQVPIRLRPGNDNYVLLRLKIEEDSLGLAQQFEFARTRSHHLWSKRLAFVALAPFGVGAAYWALSQWRYRQAEQNTQHMRNSVFTQSEQYKQWEQEFLHRKQQGDDARQRALLAGGISLFTCTIAAYFYF